MITLSESGLADAVEYADIQSHIEDISAAITIQRYGPVWTTHDTEPTRSGENFDAVIAGAYLLRTYVVNISDIEVERLADESGGDTSWISVGVALNVSEIDVDVPPSLVASGLTARIFYYSTAGKIKYTENTDISANNFTAPVEVGAVANVIYLAAVSTTKVYYITENANHNRVLHVYEYNGSWSNTDSDIYWPYPIHAFDAVIFETGRDLLMLATDLPPLIGSRVVGAEVQQEVTRVQGLVTFWVANGRWSDHDIIDVIDKVEVSPSRTSLRLSFHNNILFGAYTRRGGTENYPHSKAAVIRSKDGANWEFPELIDGLTPPFAVLPRTDYLYAVGVSKTKRSPCCAWAGQTPAELDVTDYVVGLESTAAEIRNSQVRLSNPADVLAGTLAKEDARLQVVYDLGYVVSGSNLRIQVSVEDVISRQAQSVLPHQGIGLATRDFLGRVNRTRSDYAAEWPNMQAGRDVYNDPSETGYGGMRHTAPYEGSWKTPGGKDIHLVSKNKEGLAVSTFVTDALNGSPETAFQVATASNGEYAGVAFRTFDKDNLHLFIYNQDTDKLKLVKGVGTDTNDDDERDDTTLATSYSTMSWSIATWYWLKVVVRYSLVYAFYSTDGITWTAVTWADGAGGSTDPIELVGQRTAFVGLANDARACAVTAGRFGLIGYGYSADDTWPPYTPPPWIPPGPPAGDIVVVMTDAQIGTSIDFFTATSPDWTDAGTGLSGKFYNFVVAADRQAWMITYDGAHTDTTGLFYCSDILAAIPVWALIFSHDAANADAGVSGYILKSLAITNNDTVYIAMTRQPYPNEAMGYWTVTGVTISAYVSVARPPNCFVKEGPFGLATSADGTEVFCGGGGNYSAAAHVVSLPSENYVKAITGLYKRDMITLSEHYCMGSSAPGSEIFKHTVDLETVIYSDAIARRPLIEAGDSLFYTKGVAPYLNYLMKDGSPLEDPVDVFGTDRLGGGYCCCDDNPDKIIWLGQEDHTHAASCRIAYSPDGAISWLVKDGNWATAIGNWDGWAGGDADGTPVVKHYQYYEL